MPMLVLDHFYITKKNTCAGVTKEEKKQALTMAHQRVCEGITL